MQISHQDLSAVSVQAQAEHQAMLELANVTRWARNQSYEELWAQNEEFVQNMTLKKALILEAQEAVRNPGDLGRKRRSVSDNSTNNNDDVTDDNVTDTENTTSTTTNKEDVRLYQICIFAWTKNPNLGHDTLCWTNYGNLWG